MLKIVIIILLAAFRLLYGTTPDLANVWDNVQNMFSSVGTGGNYSMESMTEKEQGYDVLPQEVEVPIEIELADGESGFID